jgi:hypothetical protein
MEQAIGDTVIPRQSTIRTSKRSLKAWSSNE